MGCTRTVRLRTRAGSLFIESASRRRTYYYLCRVLSLPSFRFAMATRVN